MNEGGATPLIETDAQQLLGIARDSIAHAVERGAALPVLATGCARTLQLPGASFVSLYRRGALRGCVGSIEAERALVIDVAENACAASLRDFRFTPLARHELPGLEVSVHVLSAPRPLPFEGLAELYAKLERGRDGLILELAQRRAVFLPVMWEQLPEPQDFVRALLHKAGIAPGTQLDALRARRFGVQVIG